MNNKNMLHLLKKDKLEDPQTVLDKAVDYIREVSVEFQSTLAELYKTNEALETFFNTHGYKHHQYDVKYRVVGNREMAHVTVEIHQ